MPGWDCHGLPIELAVEKKHGRPGQKLDAAGFRAACRAFAAAQVDAQRADFKRLGVFGDWERPYLTMDPRYEAQQIRALGKIINNGHLYRGAQAGALVPGLPLGAGRGGSRVRGQDLDRAIDVAFRVADVADFARRQASSVPAIGSLPVSGHLDHDALDAAGERGGGGPSGI